MSENQDSEATKEISDGNCPSSMAEEIGQHASVDDVVDSRSQAPEKQKVQPEKPEEDEEGNGSSPKQHETTDTLPDANQRSSEKPDHAPPNPSTSDENATENKGDPLPRSTANIQSDGEWHAMLEQLKQRMAHTEHGKVPRFLRDDPKLGEWVIQQRRGYKRRMRGVSFAMTTERIEALEALAGWTWNVAGEKSPAAEDAPTEAPQRTKIEMKKNKMRTLKLASHPHQVDDWEAMYEELKRYHSSKGDCMVPTSYAANPELSKFVNAQRRFHKELMQGRTNSLTKERVDSLNSLGFVFVASRGRKQKHNPAGEGDHEQKQIPLDIDLSSSHGWKVHEEKWQLMFEQLKSYKEANGHCMVPPRYTKNELLAEWVKNERKSFRDKTQGKASSLSKEKIDALNSLGFSWVAPVPGRKTRAEGGGSRKVSSNEGENTAKMKTTDEGDPNVGKSTPIKEDKWMAMFQKLSQYKEERGDCQVPRSHPELGEWCKTQRRKYKERMDGGKSASMTDARMEKLNDLGFQWVVGSPRKRKGTSDLAGHESKRHQICETGLTRKEEVEQIGSPSEWSRHNDRWYSMLDELDTYRTIHGDCNVPRGYKENPQLAEWCKTQRRAYKNKLGTRAMSEERIAALEELGFCWLAQPSGPKSKKSGTIADDGGASAFVSSKTKERNKRKKIEKRTHSPKKNIRDDNWHDMFQALSQYKVANGNCMVPRASHPKLAEWCKTQKRTWRKRKEGISLAMSQERIDALEALGFDFENSRAKKKGKSLIDCPDDGVGAETKLLPREGEQAASGGTSQKRKAPTEKKRVNLKDTRWQEMFQALSDYKDEHGDCVVPRSYKRNPQLGEWVKTQRRKYKLQKEGKSNAMTESRQEALEKLGFSWFVKSGRVPGRKNTQKDSEAHSAKEKRLSVQGEVTATTADDGDEKVSITSDQPSQEKVDVIADSRENPDSSSNSHEAHSAKEKKSSAQGEVAATSTVKDGDKNVPITSAQSSEEQVAAMRGSSSKDPSASSNNPAVGAKEKKREGDELKEPDVQVVEAKEVAI